MLLLSPSYDIVSKTGSDIPILAARVKDVSHRSGPQQAAVAAGWKPSDTGPRVAFASFAYVAAVPGSTRHSQHMVAGFRDTVWLSYQA